MTALVEFQKGRAAVITGAASGIGRAAADHFAQLGMTLALIDRDAAGLEDAVNALSAQTRVSSYCVDVSDGAALHATAEKIAKEFGPISVLFANAGIQPGSAFFQSHETWHRVLDVNFWGIVNTVNAFEPALTKAAAPARILITGSKQGITSPPGDPAYNISKAAVKTYAEALEHELRNRPDGKIKVHLVIPGFVWTPLTYNGRTEKPAGAWTAEETIAFVMTSVAHGDFYILCPDHDVNRALDEKRIAWAAGDIIENRPPLSRWHKDYADAFTASLKR